MKQKGFNNTLDSARVMGHKPTLLQRLHIDGWLLLIILATACIGLAVLYSAGGKSQALVYKQMSSLGAGVVVMLIVAQFQPRLMARWAALLYTLGLVLLVVVEVAGHHAMGATRWINIPGVMRFQPSELMKIFMPLTIAWYLSRHFLPPRFKHIAISLLLIAIPCVLIVRQPDLGTALLVSGSGLFVLFLSGLRWRWILAAGAAAIPVAAVFWNFLLHGYQRQRVMTFLNPESDPLGSGWNIIQSKAAIGSGGITGKGWLQGTQSHLDFLPESHTDFIIAVLAEEFGLVGACLLLLCYLLLILRGFFIALHAQTVFDKLLAGSITLAFFVYVFVNIGMVSGLLPVVGVPLPLISYGGTSLVTLMSSFGILMAIHTHRSGFMLRQSGFKEIRHE